MSKFILFDLESTGLNTSEDHIIEIAGMEPKSGSIFHKYVKPPHEEEEEEEEEEIGASHIHGITWKLLKEKNAKGGKEVLSEFIKWIGDSKQTYLIAHNCFGYDQLLLESELKRYDLKLPDSVLFIDTLIMFRNTGRFDRLSLKFIHKSMFGREFSGEHSAIGDVKALWKCVAEFSNWEEVMTSFCRDQSSNAKKLDWFYLLNAKEKMDFEVYGYDSIEKLVSGYKKYPESVPKLIKSIISGTWIYKKFMNQLKHLM